MRVVCTAVQHGAKLLQLSFTFDHPDTMAKLMGQLKENLPTSPDGLLHLRLCLGGKMSVLRQMAEQAACFAQLPAVRLKVVVAGREEKFSDIPADHLSPTLLDLGRFASLESVSLCNVTSAQRAVACLSNSSSSLTRLSLDCCRIDQSAEAPVSLAAALEPLSSLASLSLVGNRLTPHLGVAAALAAASTLPRLRRLDLSRIGLGAGDSEGLVAAVGYLKLLEALELGHNPLGEHAAAVVAAAGLTLAALGLSSNGLGDAGGMAVAAKLPRLTGLWRLDLSDNELGTAAGLALGAGLAGLTLLQELHVGCNPLGEAGAAAVVDALVPRHRALEARSAHATGCG
jgi:hypothetical protein